MKQNYIEKKIKKSQFSMYEVASSNPLNIKVGHLTSHNIFLNQNMGKGPPGRTEKSGLAKTQYPDNIEGLANLIAFNSLNVPKQISKEQTFNYLLINKTNHSLIFKFFKS